MILFVCVSPDPWHLYRLLGEQRQTVYKELEVSVFPYQCQHFERKCGEHVDDDGDGDDDDVVVDDDVIDEDEDLCLQARRKH